MIFKVGDSIIDTAVTPVGLIFIDKEEAGFLGGVLSSLRDDIESDKDNGRWWFMSPGSWTIEQKDQWSILTDEQKEMLYNHGKLGPKQDFVL